MKEEKGAGTKISAPFLREKMEIHAFAAKKVLTEVA